MTREQTKISFFLDFENRQKPLFLAIFDQKLLRSLKNFENGQKHDFFAKKWQKIENFQKKFFFKIDSESFKRNFKAKISKKIFLANVDFCPS